MSLPIKLPFLDKKPKIEYFLALLLRDEKVTAVIFEQQLGKITILSKQEAALSSSIETLELDNIVQTLDTVITKAEESLPSEVEVQNTIFGVKETWVEEKKIKKEYLNKLKHICEQLSLTPIGFIVLSEAIAHLIKQEEGAPVTALLTEVGKDTVTVSLFRAGKLVEFHQNTITGTPMETVDNTLKEFERVEILPSRVILLHTTLINDKNENDDLAQQFIAHQWSKGLPFLHVPQVSILPTSFDAKAIVAGAATQLGFDMNDVIMATKEQDIKNYEEQQTISSGQAISQEVREEHELENPEKQMTESTEEKNEHATEETHFTADNFGFVMNKEITDVKQEPKPAMNKPVRQELSEHKDEKPEETSTLSHENVEDEYEEADAEVEGNKNKNKKLAFLAAIAPLTKFGQKIKLPPLPIKSKLFFLPLLIILLLFVISVIYFLNVKATVTLALAPKSVEETQKVTFSTTAGNNYSQNMLAAKEVTVSVDGTSSTNATGEKEVGNQAKGTVTLYNSDIAKKDNQARNSSNIR